jgi:hypothetical protein
MELFVAATRSGIVETGGANIELAVREAVTHAPDSLGLVSKRYNFEKMPCPTLSITVEAETSAGDVYCLRRLLLTRGGHFG